MNWKKITSIVTFVIIPALIAGILIYDALAVHFGGTESSISSLIIVSAYKMPFMVVCIVGPTFFLFGHLFWRMRGNKDTKEIDKNE